MKSDQERLELRYILAENLRRERRALRLTQEQFASRCGLHRTYIGAIERGERNITLQTLQTVATALDMEPSTLLQKRG